VVHYVAGIGTHLSFLGRVFSGATGTGLIDKIYEAYNFVVESWEEGAGDEIYLIGFSRGAYTARMVGALICEFGLLKKHSMKGFYEVINAYHAKSRQPQSWDQCKDKWEHVPDVHVKCIGVWDTVGAMGIPEVYLFGTPIALIPGLHWLLHGINEQHSFNETFVSEKVDFAFQGYTRDVY
jgi:uncharacterized protein (DUF2235 family)